MIQTNIAPFLFEGGSLVRAISRGTEPWFVLIDICRVLEVENPRNITARLDDDERDVHTMDTPGGPQDMTIINESGLYSLILTSRKPAAKRFKKWVTSVVLPAIRQTGGYTVDPLPATTPAPYAALPPMSDDLLRGADAIAGYLGMTRRQVYHLSEDRSIPTFKMGATVCARKSTLVMWMIEQERLVFPQPHPLPITSER